MIRVHVLTEEGSQSSVAFNFPLRLHRSLLRRAGMDVRLFEAPPSEEVFECDVLFLNHNVFGSIWPGLQGEVAGVLEKGQDRVGRVVWFDTSASSGTTMFEVLPYVSVYGKAQVLKDRAEYLKAHHGDRVFTDYYYREERIQDEDDERLPRVIPPREGLAKIHVSWNTALGDFGARARRYRRFGKYVPSFRRYSARFVPPDRPRTVDVACRMGLGHARATVRHHRRKIQEVLQHDLGLDTRPLPRENYLKELRHARVGISPFGYGEVCFRDFEVILAGAALVKPDMSHMDTWPPLYVEGTTYAPHRWDVSDLRPTLEGLLANGRWREMAENAQRLYRRYLFEREGHEEFCSRVLDIVRACG